MNSITIIGLGWLGNACATYFSENNFNVTGTKREVNSTFDFPIFPWSLGEDFPEEALSEIILISISLRGADVYHFQKLFENLKHPKVKKVLFISTTSVYHLVEGNSTEDTQLKTTIETNIQLAVSELILKMLPNAMVLRLSGLVGPGRHPAYFLSGKKNVANPNQLVNLVHLDDVIGLIHLCIQKELYGVLNVCSSAQPTRKEFYTKICVKEGIAIPEFSDYDEEATRWVSNVKSKKELGYTYRYDDLLAYYLSSAARA